MALGPSNLRSLPIRMTVVVILLCLSGGCGRQPTPPPAARTIRITPSKLFVGDLKRLEPHLGLASGCVRFDFQGDDLFIVLENELWQDGKRVKSLDASSDRCQGPGELSISLKELTGPKGMEKYQLVTAKSGEPGSSATRTTVDIPVGNTGGMKHYENLELRDAIDLSEGESIAVWGYAMLANVEQPYSPPRSIKEGVERATWAILFKVSWKVAKDR